MDTLECFDVEVFPYYLGYCKDSIIFFWYL